MSGVHHPKAYICAGEGFRVGTRESNIEVIDSVGSFNPSLKVKAGEAITAGNLVYISGWDAANKIFIVKKAKADASTAAGKCAHFVAPEAIANGAIGIVRGMHELTNQNANYDVGTPVYLSTIAGGWTNTASSTAGQSVQYVGVVTAKSATAGKVLLFPFYSKAIVA
ncbi:MAG TPA: hypothetical protein PKI14_09915 [Fervidobacterium sp.]|nr:hypothetical protein [Fervidobacterium sp.]